MKSNSDNARGHGSPGPPKSPLPSRRQGPPQPTRSPPHSPFVPVLSWAAQAHPVTPSYSLRPPLLKGRPTPPLIVLSSPSSHGPPKPTRSPPHSPIVPVLSWVARPDLVTPFTVPLDARLTRLPSPSSRG